MRPSLFDKQRNRWSKTRWPSTQFIRKKSLECKVKVSGSKFSESEVLCECALWRSLVLNHLSQAMTKKTVFIHCFSCCCYKGSLGREGFILAHSLRGHSSSWWEGVQAGTWNSWSQCIQSQETERWILVFRSLSPCLFCCCCFDLFYSSQDWSPLVVLPTFMVALLSSSPSGNTLTDMTRVCLLGDSKSNLEAA